jgi:hypothetical protein
MELPSPVRPPDWIAPLRPIGLTEPFGLRQGSRTACRLTSSTVAHVVTMPAKGTTWQPRQAVVPGLPGAAQLVWQPRQAVVPGLPGAAQLVWQPRQAVVPGLPGAAQLVRSTPSDLWSVQLATQTSRRPGSTGRRASCLGTAEADWPNLATRTCRRPWSSGRRARSLGRAKPFGLGQGLHTECRLTSLTA